MYGCFAGPKNVAVLLYYQGGRKAEFHFSCLKMFRLK